MGGTRSKGLLFNSTIYSISNVALKFISFLLFPLFAQNFSPAEYGVIGVLSTLSLLAGSLTTMGLDIAINRFFFDNTSESYRNNLFYIRFVFQLFVTFVISLGIILFLKDFLVSNYLHHEQGSLLIFIVLANLLLGMLPNMLNSLLILENRSVLSLAVTVFLTLTSACASLLLVFVFDLGVAGFFLGQTIGFFFVSIAGAFLFFRKFKNSIFDINVFKQMFSYGINAMPGMLSNQLLLFITTLIIQPLTSQNDLGFFQVAYTIATFILVFTSGFAQAFLPYTLSLEEDELKKRLVKILDSFCIGIGFIVASSTLFFKEAISVLLGTKYLPCTFAASVLTFSNFLSSINSITTTGLIKTKRIHFYSGSIIISNFINLILVGILTKTFGLNGAAVSFPISQLIGVALLFKYSQKFYFIPYHFTTNLSIVLFYLLFVTTVLHFENTIGSLLLLKIVFVLVGLYFLFKKNYSLISSLKRQQYFK